MDKLTAIKIKYDDGTYSDEIPISVLSKNVEWDSAHTLVDVLGSIDVDIAGTIQDQISQLFNEKVTKRELNHYVDTKMMEDVSAWLNNNVNPVGSAVIVDNSLSIKGAAADSYSTGIIKQEINSFICEHDYTQEIEKNAAFITTSNWVDYDDYKNKHITPLANWGYIIINCKCGDYFNIKCVSASGAKAYVFTEEDGTIIASRYGNMTDPLDYYLITPSKATKIIINVRIDKEWHIYKGYGYKNKIDNLSISLNNISNEIEKILISEWEENSVYFLSSSKPTSLFSPARNQPGRCCVLKVDTNDIIIYNGNNIIDENDSASAARCYGFFDINGNLLSFASTGYYYNYEIIIPEGVEYLVLNQSPYDNGFKDCFLYHPKNKKSNINLSVFNRMLTIVDDYQQEGIVYNSAYSPWYYKEEYGDKRGLTCSDWAMISFFGMDARQNTKWFNINNTPAYGFECYKDLFNFKNDERGAWSEQIGKFIDDNGYSFIPDETLSNCLPGDILLYNLNSENDNDPMDYFPTGQHLTRYKGIDHSAVFGYRTPNKYLVFEVAGSPKSNIGYVSSRYVGFSDRPIVMAIRPISYIDYKPLLLTKYSQTRETKRDSFTIPIQTKNNNWKTVIVNAKRKETSFLKLDVLYAGDTTWSSILSESITGFSNDSLSYFLFKPKKNITQIQLVSVTSKAGDPRGFYLYDIEVYDGFSFGTIK